MHAAPGRAVPARAAPARGPGPVPPLQLLVRFAMGRDAAGNFKAHTVYLNPAYLVWGQVRLDNMGWVING